LTALIGGLLAALFFAGSTLGSARSTRMIGAMPALGGVLLVSALVAAPIVLVTTAGSPVPTDDWLWLLLSGAGNVGGLLFKYVGLRTGKVGLVASLAATEGAVAALFAVIGGEELAPLVGVGVAIVAVGVVVTAFAPDPDTPAAGARRLRWALFFGALAGLSFGASLYATGRLGASLPLGWALVPPRIVGVAAITLPLLATSRLRVTRPSLPFVGLSGACEVGGFLSYAWGAGGGIAVSSALAAQFASIAALGAWFLFGERLSRPQWAGVASVALGVVILAAGSG
jgi:drug/metabolite transporter (DMT)-like permease